MKFCSSCGTELLEGYQKCPNCGAEVLQSTFENNGNNANTQRSFEVNGKFCAHCGKAIHAEAVVCPNCGCSTQVKSESSSASVIVIKVFMILSCIAAFFALLFPLAWCLPMTISAFRKMERGEKMDNGFKVCTLIFVNMIAGIVMLCDEKL